MRDNIHRVKKVLRAYGGSQLLTSSNIKPITKWDFLRLNLLTISTQPELKFNALSYSTTFWDSTADNGKGHIVYTDPSRDVFNRPIVVPLAPELSTEQLPSETEDKLSVLETSQQLLEALQQLQQRMLTIRSMANGVTLAGMLTGNKTMMDAGLIGSATLGIADLLKAMKGTKGINKASGIGGIAGTIADTAGDVLFSGAHDKDSSLTTGLNTGYDAISSSLMGFTPVGTIIGGAMKVGGFVGDALSSMGVGTDQMTTSDLILDSNFLKLTPMGLVNAIGAKKTLNFSANTETIELVGGSYGGSVKGINDAASKAGKKYGLFSSGSRKNANNQIDVARGLLNTMTGIANEASDMSSIASNMAQLNHMNYSFNLNGGYDLRYMRAATNGGKLDRIKKLNLSRFKTGGTIGSVNLNTKEIEWTPVITDPIEVYEDGGKFDWTPIITEVVELFEKGGKTPEIEETTLKNVIPEGALHARNHHMENAEGLTLKGIPVVDDDKEQQAEIELNEIIFTLEVTKKLEELLKDGSDSAAIEAGKLLVELILFNTDDRTGLISTLKLGGTIQAKNEQ